MSGLFTSLKSIADNYGQGIMTIPAQFEDMKFGFMPTTSVESKSFTSSASSTPSSPWLPSSSRKIRLNNNNNNNIAITNNNNNNPNRHQLSPIVNQNNNMSSSSTSSVTPNAPLPNSASDFNQWLHAMKMVARLPGGTPPEFRRKLWLALADRHLYTSGIDWNKEQTRCLSDAWLDDDEELGIQIVKDLHRTGSSLFSGPNGDVNQAKLKSVLLGYARWNPEVGYCQGFNMLGALILQVMDKSEIEALKVMIYLIEGVLPSGYFCGSLSGLQADMAVFREILSTRLPKLSKHLQRLQRTIGEGSQEPPLINVFTMQWFLTLFCTCLPTSCVLRVWDLILIEGSDILLRTALAIWTSIAERILKTKTADEFYCKMGTLSGELLNGHLFDSNGLVQRIVDLGPIADLQKMREKHLFNIQPWKDRGRGIKIFYSDDDGDSDDETWKFMAGARRASIGISAAAVAAANRNQIPLNDARDRIALDISLLKKQYNKLRDRQRQAHIILTNTARQTVHSATNMQSSANVNQYLVGKNAIVSNKGKRIGPPVGAIPPARTTMPMTATSKQQQKRLRNATIGSTCPSASLKVSDDNFNIQKSPSAASSISSISSMSDVATTSKKLFARKRSESSSYDEDSDDNNGEEFVVDGDSSTSTSLCDEDLDQNVSSIEASPLKMRSGAGSSASQSEDSRCSSANAIRASDARQNFSRTSSTTTTAEIKRSFESEGDAISGEFKRENVERIPEEISPMTATTTHSMSASMDLDLSSLGLRTEIASTSQLSPIDDISQFLATSSISPLRTPCMHGSRSLCDTSEGNSASADEKRLETKRKFSVNDEGVINEYFERINKNPGERPSMLQLHPDSANFQSLAKKTPIKHSKSDASDISSATIRHTPEMLSLPLILTCTDITRITPDQSPLINKIEVDSSSTEPIVSEMGEKTGKSSRSTDRILKIIEENSKILDRIMSKNSKSTAIEEIKFELMKTSPQEAENVLKIEVNKSPIGDDFLSSYLKKFSEEKSIKIISENNSNATDQKIKSPKSYSMSFDSEEKTEASSGRSVDEIIQQALKNSSISSSLPNEPISLDPKIENDLQTLLKMSAELLREEMPPPPQLSTSPSQLPSNSNSASNLSELKIDSSETELRTDDIEEKKNLIEFDVESSKEISTADNTIGDISATISSIKNTIKSIDDLCQDDDRRSRERTDRTLEDIIKAVEKIEDDGKSKKNADAPSIVEHLARIEPTPIDDFQLSRNMISARMSRDRSRLTSPRRRKDDDFGEYESRARRSKSPSFNADELTKKYGLDEYSSPKKPSSPFKTNEKLELRHTTVTATFYDRFLSQKLEQQHRMDRSPSSPVITKEYLESLRSVSPTLLSSSYTDGYSARRDVDSKSNESSPSRYRSTNTSSANRTDFLSDLTSRPSILSTRSQIESENVYTKSCENIPSSLRLSSLQASNYAKRSEPIVDQNVETNFERYTMLSTSDDTSAQRVSPLPQKVKKPSELGIKLGMYKPLM